MPVRRARRAVHAAIGGDLGGTNLKLVLVRRGRVVVRRLVPVPRRDARAVLSLLRGEIRSIATASVTMPVRHLAAALAVPGFLDARRRRLLRLTNLPALEGVPLAERLERSLRDVLTAPVTLETDTNAGAWGEWRRGAGRGARRLLYVSLGTGVGASLLAEGEIVRISHHAVGHIAHIPLDPDGPRCPCGGRGCAELLLGARGVVRRARRLGVPAPAASSPSAVHEAALAGSAAAREALSVSGTLLGRLLAVLTALLQPDRIVIGGGLAGAARFLLPPARREWRRLSATDDRGSVRLTTSALGGYAGAIGAALLALETPAGVSPA